MSWADRLQASPPSPEEHEPMHYLTTTIRKAKEYCEDNRQDWVVFVTGAEGSGKSTLASHIAKMFDPNVSLQESMIYSFKDGDHSFLGFMQKFQDTPFKVGWYDEAVTVLFSLRHSSRDSADAQEIFKISRDCRHFSILVSPSFWDVVPDIRERRTKSLLYCFTEVVHHPGRGRPIYVHKYAYFSGEKITRLSLNKKAKYVFRDPHQLFQIVKPDFIEQFPDMDKKIQTEYMAAKRANRCAILDRISGPGHGAEAMLAATAGVGKPLDFSAVRQQLILLNGGVDPDNPNPSPTDGKEEEEEVDEEVEDEEEIEEVEVEKEEEQIIMSNSISVSEGA